MKKLITFLGLYPYYYAIPLLYMICFEPSEGDSMFPFFGVYVIGFLILAVLVPVINIISLIKINSNQDALELSKISLITKLVHIPFFLLVIYCGGVAWSISIIPGGAIISYAYTILFFLIDVSVMINTSLYSIFAIIKHSKIKNINIAITVLFVISQILFGLDLVGVIILYITSRNKKQNTSKN